jgi:hypothetical protein
LLLLKEKLTLRLGEHHQRCRNRENLRSRDGTAHQGTDASSHALSHTLKRLFSFSLSSSARAFARLLLKIRKKWAAKGDSSSGWMLL